MCLNHSAILTTVSNRNLKERFGTDHVLISLDVVSLFMNIFIDLAIVSIDTRWHFFMNTMKIPREELISAIRLVRFIFASMAIFTKLQYFYRTPLFPIVADLVMRDLEALKTADFQLLFYFRYIDDIVYDSSKKILLIYT